MLLERAPSCRQMRWPQPVNEAEDLSEHRSWDGDLRQLESDIATMAHDLRADLDQLFPQRGQRPVLHFLGQGKPAQEVAPVVSESVELRADYLGVMYERGQGVTQDDAEAVNWYCKAAEQGIAKAQYNRRNMYRNGQGVSRDDAEAVKWYRKAAEQGDAGTQYNLGLMYGKGLGVPQDYAQAPMWFNLTASRFPPARTAI